MPMRSLAHSSLLVDPVPGTVAHAAEVSRLLSAAERAGIRVSYAWAMRAPLIEVRFRVLGRMPQRGQP